MLPAMTIDPRLVPIAAVASRDIPRAWITAARPLHQLLIDAVVEIAPANLIIAPTEGGSAVDTASVRIESPLTDHLKELSTWVIVVEAHLLDAGSLEAISSWTASPIPIIVIQSTPTPGPDLLGAGLVPQSGWYSEPWHDAETVERWLSIRIGRQLTDATISEVAALSGTSSFLLALLGDALAHADIQMPGSADTTPLNDTDGVLAFVSSTLDGLELPTSTAIRVAALTQSPVERDARPSAFSAGLADADGVVFPAVREAILHSLSDTEKRDTSSDVLASLLDGTIDETEATLAFLDLGRVPQQGRDAVLQTSRKWLLNHPDRALAALDLIPEVALALELRMRALALTGRMSDAAIAADRVLANGPSPQAGLVTAAGMAAGARFTVAARSYEAADPANDLRIGAGRLSGPALATIGGRPTPGNPDVGSVTAAAITQFAAGALGVVDGTPGAIATLRDGAELAAKSDATLWPDTPHTLAATTLMLGFDLPGADQLIAHAGEFDVGGAAHRSRHVLISGWIALRQGRWLDAESAITDMDARPLSLRDRLSLAALNLGLARRAGDIGRLESGLESAFDLVLRHPVDLISLISHTEIAVAGGRMGAVERTGGLLDQIDSFVEDLTPEPWHDHAGWSRVVAGLLTSRPEWIEDGTRRLQNVTLSEAGRIALDPGDASVEETVTICESLGTMGQIHEAATLASAGAFGRTTTQARPLVMLAVRLRSQLPGRGRDSASGLAALSDREREVARELMDGRRYKEIGERLFISAKTVEHHVAHIKTKLGAASRAEMISALRQEFD